MPPPIPMEVNCEKVGSKHRQTTDESLEFANMAAIREAFKRPYFPGGLKPSQFEDVGFFPEAHALNFEFEPHPESNSDSDPGTDSNSNGLSSHEDSDFDSEFNPKRECIFIWSIGLQVAVAF